MKIAELFAEVGFKFDTIKLNEVVTKISQLNLSSVVSASSVAKLGDTIKDTLTDIVATSQALTTLSTATGFDPEYIQRFEKFSQILGSTKEEVDSFLSTIGKLQLAISQGKGDATPFVLLGINPLGKSKEELAGLINQRFSDENFLKQWAGNFAKGAKNIDEIRAELKRQVAGGLGIGDSLIRPLSSKDFARQLNPATSTIPVLSTMEIRDAVRAQQELTIVTQKLTTQFQVLVGSLLPWVTTFAGAANATLGTVNKSVGMQNLNFLSGIVSSFPKILNIGGQLERPGANKTELLNELKTIMRETFHTTGASKSVGDIHVTVHSNTPEEFVRRFDPIWRKHISQADLQFGQQT